MKKLIAHRGNIDGPNTEENKPEYLLQAIHKGFFVELDLWYVNDTLYLGHDNPEYKIDYSFLLKNKDKMFIHCKNIEALHYCLEKHDNLEFFFHDLDDCVLTSKGTIWTSPGKTLTDKSISVMPERSKSDDDLAICAGICTDYVLKYKPKIAILLSGHVRNFHDIINNLKENLIKPLEQVNYNYDINIHTWDTNIIETDTFNNNKHYSNVDVNEEYIQNLFKKNNLNINKISIENQKEVEDKLNVKMYLDTQLEGRSIHNKFEHKSVRDITNSLFFQYYGHYKVLQCLDSECKYDFIIKTRPDMFYEKFEVSLLDHNLFFPHSHQRGGSNINQLFFGGKTKYMTDVLKYFQTVIFHNNYMNFQIINKYHESDINFNNLFRYYIMNHLDYQPFFTTYNPKIYRNATEIITIA